MLWKYLFGGPYGDKEEFRGYLKDLEENVASVAFTVIDKPSQQPIGIVTYMNIVPGMRRLEIGGIWYTPKFHRTYANTEACYLLLKYAFEDLQYRRVEWKCGALLNSLPTLTPARCGYLHSHLKIT